MTLAGFVGHGLIGSRRRGIVESLGLDVAFVVEPAPGPRAAIEGASFPVVASIDEIGDTTADVVFVAVPHDLAAQTCLWAIGRGAHVMCEKPMGLTSAQAQEILEAAHGAGRQFSAGFNYRYLAGVSKLRELLRDGLVGDVVSARLMMGHGGRPGMEKEWKLDPLRAGGGVLIDPGIHLVDLASHLFGTPTVSDARLRKVFWDAPVDDVCSLALRCASTDVSIDVNLISWKNLFSIEVYGTKATVRVTGRGGNYGAQEVEFTNRWFWDGDDRRESWNFGVDDASFRLEVEAFLELVRSGSHDGVLSTSRDGISALTTVESAYELAKWNRFAGGPSH